jgi:hypothetical protein
MEFGLLPIASLLQVFKLEQMLLLGQKAACLGIFLPSKFAGGLRHCLTINGKFGRKSEQLLI